VLTANTFWSAVAGTHGPHSGKYVRQTILLTDYLFPDANALFNKHCYNIRLPSRWGEGGVACRSSHSSRGSLIRWPQPQRAWSTLWVHYAGKVRIREPQYKGTISLAIPEVQKLFHRVPTTSADSAEDTRFEYFIEKVWPLHSTVESAAAAHLLTARPTAPTSGSAPLQVFKPLKASGTAGSHTAIMLSNYLDYTRLRRYFRENDIEFEGICEYTPPPKVSRARTLFYNGQAPLLLYTERFHYYWRCGPIRAPRLLLLRLTGLWRTVSHWIARFTDTRSAASGT